MIRCSQDWAFRCCSCSCRALQLSHVLSPPQIGELSEVLSKAWISVSISNTKQSENPTGCALIHAILQSTSLNSGGENWSVRLSLLHSDHRANQIYAAPQGSGTSYVLIRWLSSYLSTKQSITSGDRFWLFGRVSRWLCMSSNPEAVIGSDDGKALAWLLPSWAKHEACVHKAFMMICILNWLPLSIHERFRRKQQTRLKIWHKSTVTSDQIRHLWFSQTDISI